MNLGSGKTTLTLIPLKGDEGEGGFYAEKEPSINPHEGNECRCSQGSCRLEDFFFSPHMSCPEALGVASPVRQQQPSRIIQAGML